MAVIQISRIQLRRGLQENIPQLASGEMGWSLDARRLWVGNGALSEGAPITGNTEILTQYSDLAAVIETYTFQGVESGYISQTGPSANLKVSRSLLNKLDEQISFRDFITDVDIASGDYSLALQRAIDEIFPLTEYTNSGVRRVLHIPAGNYPITVAIAVPSFARLVGDGPESSFITQTISDVVFKFKDSLGQVDAAYGTNSAEVTREVEFSDLTIQNNTSNDLVTLNSAQDIGFYNVQFTGSIASPLSLGSAKTCVRGSGTIGASSKIYFHRCKFSDIASGCNFSGVVKNVTIDSCEFYNLYQGILLSDTGGTSPKNIKVIATVFDNIAQQAVVSSNNSSVSGIFNYYGIVGLASGVDMDSGTPTSEIISWATPDNYSIGEANDRTAATLLVYPFVVITATTIPTSYKTNILGSLHATPGFTETLADNTTANTSVLLSTGISNIIDYQISRSVSHRIGSIKVTNYNGSPVFQDDYTETGVVGTTLNFNTSGTNAILAYTTTATGLPATFKYQIRSFI